jgi:guanine deaminase
LTAGVATALRGRLAYCVDDPFLVGARKAFVSEDDGGVVCRDGLIEDVGPWAVVRKRLPPGAKVIDHSGKIIAPGFVDTHVHYVQTEIIGARSAGLLEWLDACAYPAERRFARKAHASRIAKVFCDELLRAGTTAAMVFCSVHPGSVDALFEEAGRRRMRMIAGKVLMDRNVPKDLRDGAQRGYDESKALLQKWHGRGRLQYAITPRFAASCSPAQLEAAGALWKEFPGAHVQSHVSESPSEVAWIKKLFPRRKGYLDVYAHHGLIGRRSVLAHGVHLTEPEMRRCHATGTAIAHCPTSNLFLGSGLFKLHSAKDRNRPVHVGLGTDVGAGTSFSMLQTLNEAYKVARILGHSLTVEQAFFLATLGGARALDLGDRIGTLWPGHEADIVVLDPRATPLLAERDRRSESIEDTLFLLLTLGDDRVVKATYVAGRVAKVAIWRRTSRDSLGS